MGEANLNDLEAAECRYLEMGFRRATVRVKYGLYLCLREEA